MIGYATVAVGKGGAKFDVPGGSGAWLDWTKREAMQRVRAMNSDPKSWLRQAGGVVVYAGEVDVALPTVEKAKNEWARVAVRGEEDRV